MIIGWYKYPLYASDNFVSSQERQRFGIAVDEMVKFFYLFYIWSTQEKKYIDFLLFVQILTLTTLTKSIENHLLFKTEFSDNVNSNSSN